WDRCPAGYRPAREPGASRVGPPARQSPRAAVRGQRALLALWGPQERGVPLVPQARWGRRLRPPVVALRALLGGRGPPCAGARAAGALPAERRRQGGRDGAGRRLRLVRARCCGATRAAVRGGGGPG